MLRNNGKKAKFRQKKQNYAKKKKKKVWKKMLEILGHLPYSSYLELLTSHVFVFIHFFRRNKKNMNNTFLSKSLMEI